MMDNEKFGKDDINLGYGFLTQTTFRYFLENIAGIPRKLFGITKRVKKLFQRGLHIKKI